MVAVPPLSTRMPVEKPLTATPVARSVPPRSSMPVRLLPPAIVMPDIVTVLPPVIRSSAPEVTPVGDLRVVVEAPEPARMRVLEIVTCSV